MGHAYCFIDYANDFEQDACKKAVEAQLDEHANLVALQDGVPQDGQSTAAGSSVGTPRASVAPGAPRIKLKMGGMPNGFATNGTTSMTGSDA